MDDLFFEDVPDANCIVCGCSDSKACGDFNTWPCHWIEVNRAAGIGVCSNPKCNTPENIEKYHNAVLEKAAGL